MRTKPNLIYRQLRKHFAGLLRLREEELPYLTRFIVSKRPAPSSPKTSDFPGLIFIQYSDPNGETEVTAYWKSREAATFNARLFKEAVGSESILSEGYVRHLAGSESPWWKRVPVGRWILYASSILGALAVLQIYFAKTFEAPNISPEISGPKILNALASDEVRFDLAITNRSRDVEAVVTLGEPKVTSAGKLVPRIFQGNLFPAPIVPTTTKIIPFVGDPLQAGTYIVTVTMKAKAGLVPKEKDFDAPPKELMVWRLNPYTHILSIETLEDPLKARIHGQLFVGAAAPNGLNCRAIIENLSTISIHSVNFPGVSTRERKPDALTPGRERISYSFQTSRHFVSMSKHHFTLMATSSKSTDWEAVKQNTTVVCTIDYSKKEEEGQ